MNRLQAWYFGLAERERRMVAIGAVAAVLVLIAGVILPLNRHVAALEQRVERKQTDLAWMRSVAPQLAAAGPVAARPATQESLIVVVDRAAREAGLGGSLTSSEPSGERGLRVRLEKAQFDTLVAWLARLSQQHGIHVESASIDGAGAPGIVNAAFVLRAG